MLHFFRKKFQINRYTITALIGLIGLSVLFWNSYFIEPHQIKVQTTDIQTGFPAKLVVISDIHLGIYNDPNFLSKVIDRINQIPDVTAVLIPGDLTYYPSGDLNQLFSPFKKLKYPAYAVLGNHDSQNPGPPIEQEITDALSANNVNFLHNTSAIIPNTNIYILGLGDMWAYQDDIRQINKFDFDNNLIVLTHNPDTTSSYTNSIADLTVCGHTHGGQIRIPLIYHFIIPTIMNFDQGLYHTTHGQVYVTSGIGVTSLPLRFNIPPTIDILELK